MTVPKTAVRSIGRVLVSIPIIAVDLLEEIMSLTPPHRQLPPPLYQVIVLKLTTIGTRLLMKDPKHVLMVNLITHQDGISCLFRSKVLFSSTMRRNAARNIGRRIVFKLISVLEEVETSPSRQLTQSIKNLHLEVNQPSLNQQIFPYKEVKR